MRASVCMCVRMCERVGVYYLAGGGQYADRNVFNGYYLPPFVPFLAML